MILDEEIVGDSPALKQVLATAKRLAASDAAVLITGEPGSGKESIARAIHRMSARRNESFVKIHGATLRGDQLERDLFGYEKGAFDDAISDKAGWLEEADKGTLFLDEIARIPLDLQSKLACVLKRGQFERLGNVCTIRVNMRLIVATKQDPEKIAEDRLHHDLYDQFKTSSIQIPPLRQRREDIPLLVRYFVQKFTRRMNKRIATVPSETIETLLNYDWPGNVRQLESFIERSVIVTDGPILQAPVTEL